MGAVREGGDGGGGDEGGGGGPWGPAAEPALPFDAFRVPAAGEVGADGGPALGVVMGAGGGGRGLQNGVERRAVHEGRNDGWGAGASGNAFPGLRGGGAGLGLRRFQIPTPKNS